MSITDNLQTLIDCKADMKSAIESKGVTVSGGLSTYADAIRSIEGEGILNMELPIHTKFGYSLFSYIPYFDTSEWTNMSNMFSQCSKLTSVPLFNTSKVTTMNYMFSGCSKLTSVPQFDTSNVLYMNYMFSGCSSLTSVPQFDMSNVKTMSYMFSQCSKLTSVPQLNTINVEDMDGAFNMCSSLTTLGLIDCSSTNRIGFFFNYSEKPIITNLDGFKNLGMQKTLFGVNEASFLYSCPKLTYQSIINVFNNLYDRTQHEDYPVLSLRLHPDSLAKLSDEDIAIATNKGWAITTT